MIQVQSILNVADNSGAKLAMCIKVLGGSKRRYARVGDLVVVVVKVASPKGGVKRKSIHRAIVVRQKKTILRHESASCVRFGDNAVVILDSTGKPRATRVFGPIAREVKSGDNQKIVSMATEIF